MKKNSKYISNPKFIIGMIAILTIISILTITATYAYFILTVSTENNQIAANSGKIDIYYQKGNDINGVLYGTTDYTRGLNTTVQIKANDGSLKANVGIYLKVDTIDEYLKSNALKWAVYKNGNANVIKSGTFETAQEGSNIQIVNDFEVTTTIQEYTIYVWLDGPSSTNNMQNQSFSGQIYAKANYISGNLE